MKSPIIVWFKNDLRLADNPALQAAIETGQEIVPLYILDDESAGDWKLGGASRWWLHHSLTALNEDLKGFGGKLVIKSGNAFKILSEFAEKLKAKKVFWNRSYEPYAREQEALIISNFEKLQIETESFNGNLLLEPWEISNKQGGYYKVFTQYWKTCLKNADLSKPLPRPTQIQFYKGKLDSDNLENWKLLPVKPDWAKGFKEYWKPGEKHAIENLNKFALNAIGDYDIKRDFPADIGTSLLSPHLHFGEISPRTVWETIDKLNVPASNVEKQASKDRYLTEIGWREFSYYLLYHFPKLPNEPFNKRFEGFPWRENGYYLRAWQRGLTGFPIVDAGMRQLWHTGWMHNRVRMIVASFLTKDLLLPWQKGAGWFWDTLVDADLANNSASWQWVAGCGADAAPYFRIFNPVTQGQKFDEEGDYIKKWVPELKDLPKNYIHCPWETPEVLLRSYGVTLGKNYPHPIVDHAKARLEALEAFKQVQSPV